MGADCASDEAADQHGVDTGAYALIALQFRRYPCSQVYIFDKGNSAFDKGNSARAAVLAMGGAHHALGSTEADGEVLAFQPLANIHRADERTWAAD